MIGTRILGATALAAALALGAPYVMAQQASPPAASSAPAKPKPTRETRVEARIKTLHAQLKITPDQEDAWNAVAGVMRDSASTIDQLSQQRAKDRTKGMSAVENLKTYQAIADAHADEMNKLVPAFQALYDKMSPAQQKNADAVFNSRGTRRAPAKKKS